MTTPRSRQVEMQRMHPTYDACMNRLRCVACLWLLLASGLALAQTDTARWVAAHALPQNDEPTALAQGSDGFLWVGGSAGLSRFDGVAWRHIPMEGTRNQRVSAVLFDPQGRLWFGSDEGLFVLAGGRPTPVARLDPADAQIRQLRWIDDALHLATTRGIFRLQLATGTLLRLPGLNGITVHDLTTEADGSGLLAATGAGLYRRRGTDWQRLSDSPIVSLERDDQRTLWLGGVELHSLRDGVLADAAIGPARRVRRLARLSNGEIWVGTHSDGIYIRARNGHWLQGDRRLHGEMITAIIEDREHNVWVATGGSGVHHFALGGMEKIESEDGLPTKLLSSIAAGEDGSLWVSTYGRGLIHIAPDRSVSSLATPCGDMLMTLFLQRPDTLWLGGEGGLCRVQSGKAMPVAETDVVTALAPAQAGGFWVLATSELQRRLDTRIVQRFERPQPVENAHANAFLDAGDGGVWVADANGLMHVGADGWRRVDAQGAILALLPADADHLWMLQQDQLVLRRRDGRRFATAAHPGAWLLARDAEGSLWQIGGAGLAQVSEQDLRIGLETRGVVPVPVVFDTVNGLDGIKPSQIGSPQIAALKGDRVAMIAYGQVRVGTLAAPRWPQLELATELTLASAPGIPVAHDGQIFAPHQRPIRMDYTAARLRDPSEVRFRYRLLPLDSGWSAPTSDRRQTFAQLPAGEYRFEVQALATDMVSMPPARFFFSVQPRWHETAWARMLAATLLLGLGAMTLRWRMQHLQARQRQLESQVTARTRELEQANQQLTLLARTDALTGLANRRVFMEALQVQCQTAHRERQPLAVLMIDVDFFKAYNDHHGHGAGDEALRQIAAVLAQRMRRPGDLVARYGGEEFVALLPQTSLEGAIGVAEAVRSAVAELALPHPGREDLAIAIATVSIGVAATQTGDEAPERVLARADAALYAAKHSGRNRVMAD